MTEFFNLIKNIKLQIQGVLNTTENEYEAKILREIIVKQLQTKYKVRIFKVPREKRQIKHLKSNNKTKS